MHEFVQSNECEGRWTVTQEMCTGCACMAMAAIGEATRERDAAIARAEAAEALAASRPEISPEDMRVAMEALEFYQEQLADDDPDERNEDVIAVMERFDAALRAHAAKVSR